MWQVRENTIEMTEGDYGVDLPITVSGVTLASGDTVKFAVKTIPNGETIIEKTFSTFQNNTVNLSLTEQETELLSVGNYVYVLDWYQNENFMCNLIRNARFKVDDKA